MPGWDYEHAYKGGPMVEVDGFPRPLYPPDAAEHGKQPSVPGPDVEAFKRGVSRGGRWLWQSFDQNYSNSFSHGKSGNVIDTGIAGFQRQMKLDATGWVGTKTFNAIRSALVPEGLPHEGEPLLDATAIDLINEAWAIFGGSPGHATDTLRQEALDLALDELGTTESPAGSNNNKYGQWYGVNYEPWCAIFVTWCYEHAGDSPSFQKGSYYAYCPYVVSDARAGRNGLSTTDDPIPGDLVVYDWSSDGTYDHIGLFEQWVGGPNFYAIEGNTSYSSNSNVGEVMRRERSRSGQATTFVRVAEP